MPGVFEIKSFRGGPSDYDDKGIEGAFKSGSNLDIRKKVDSLSCQQALVDEGLDSSASPSLSVSPSSSTSRTPSPSPSASSSPTPSPSASVSPSVSVSLSPSTTPSASGSPSPSPSAGLTTIFEDLITTFVECSDGYLRGFGDAGYVYRRDSAGYWNIEYKDANGAITGANEWSPAGVSYLYWVAGGVLSRKPLPGQEDWNDVEEVDANLNTSDWHTMREAGGALVICNRHWLAQVGYDASFANEALNLIPGNIAKTIVERNGRSIIGTVRESDTTRGVNGAIDSEIPIAQVGDDGELFFANMNDSMPITRFPGGGIINPGGIANEVDQVNFFEWEQTATSWIDKQSVGNMALMAVYDADSEHGGVYKYGRKNKNHPFVLNLDYLLDADELGAVVDFEGTTLVSYDDNGDYGVKAVDPDAKAEGTYRSLDFRSPVKKPIDIAHWKQIEVFCDPLPSGSTIAVYYQLNKAGGWKTATETSGDTGFTRGGETRAVFNMGEKATIFEFKVTITPTANSSPEINQINLHFD